FDGHLYGSYADVRKAQVAKTVLPVYHWLFDASDITVLILSACFLGALGAVVRILIRILSSTPLSPPERLFLPSFGLFAGFIILCISYALPKYLTTSESVSLNPVSIMVIALLAGIFYDHFIDWLRNIAASVFTNSSEKKTS